MSITDLFSLSRLRAMPTLCEGQAEDLKFEGPGLRVWLSRCTRHDGEPYDNRVAIEVFDEQRRRWVTLHQFEATDER